MDKLVMEEFLKLGWELIIKKELPSKWKCDVLDYNTKMLIKKDMEIQKRVTYGCEQDYIKLLIENINMRIKLNGLQKRD